MRLVWLTMLRGGKHANQHRHRGRAQNSLTAFLFLISQSLLPLAPVSESQAAMCVHGEHGYTRAVLSMPIRVGSICGSRAETKNTRSAARNAGRRM